MRAGTPSPKTKSKEIGVLRQLAVRDLQVLFGVEPNLARAFARLAKRAQSKELRKFCNDGVTYTRRRVTRVRKALTVLGAPRKSISSSGLDGLIRDARRVAEATKSPATDVAILGAIERISHYGLAAYTTIDRYLRKSEAANARRILLPSVKEKEDAIREMKKMARHKLLPLLGA